MKILHLPDARGGNPYQKHLVESLEEKVASVSVADPSEPYVFSILRALVGREDDVDVVHLHWMNTFYAGDSPLETGIKSILWPFELLILRVLGYSIVWTAHNLVPHESSVARFHHLYRHFVIKYFLSGVIAHNEPAAREIANAYHLSQRDTRKIGVAAHGAYSAYPDETSQSAARQRLNIDADSRVFLFVGQWREYKGLESLIDNFKQLEDSDARLFVVGEPITEAYGDALEQRASDDDRIRMRREFVPDEELQYYLRSSDVVVLPYTDVFTSGAAMLALSFERPVVLPERESLRAQVGDAGIYYEATVKEGLERAIASDQASLEREAKAKVDEYDWEEIAENVVKVYQKALSPRETAVEASP